MLYVALLVAYVLHLWYTLIAPAIRGYRNLILDWIVEYGARLKNPGRAAYLPVL